MPSRALALKSIENIKSSKKKVTQTTVNESVNRLI